MFNENKTDKTDEEMDKGKRFTLFLLFIYLVTLLLRRYPFYIRYYIFGLRTKKSKRCAIGSRH